MRPRLLVAVLAVVAAGCLQEGRGAEGRKLFAGRNVEKPAFIEIDTVKYVMFQVRKTPAMPPRSATYELWLVNYDTGEPRLLLENVSDREGWRPQVDPAGVRFLMVDEHSIDGGSTVGAPSPVGTLVRLDLVKGVLERIPDVTTFSVAGSNQFFYRTVALGTRLPELHFRTSDGVTRALGPSAGAAQVTGPGRMYFVSGEDRTLSRITTADGPVEVIRSKVTRFQLSDDERWVVLQTAQATSEGGKPQTVALELGDALSEALDSEDLLIDRERRGSADRPRIERRLPGMNPCCWLGFAGSEFLYSETASAGMPGKMHAFDVTTGADRVVTLPQGLTDVSSVVGRPRTNESLFGDSQGRLALAPNDDPAAGRLLDIRPMSPSFSEDGRHFLYIEPDPVTQGEGRLMIRDGDFLQPPREISPSGALVPQGGFFFIRDGQRRILVFWAHFGRNASDLYFANHETGDHWIVANGISQVTVTARRVIGILHVSEQDLVGDLVNKDLNPREGVDPENVLAHSVADATVWKEQVAFVIRERVPSENDGLWAIPIDGVNGGMALNP